MRDELYYGDSVISAPREVATLEGHPRDMEDGIYFGLPEDQYHALRRFSASGIKAARESWEDFWEQSWMNPQPTREESPQMALGSAMHKRILEGKAAFDAAYFVALDRADYPSALVTTEDLKTALRDRDLKVSGNKPELIARLVEDDPSVQVWERMVEIHNAANAGKMLISPDDWLRVEITAAMIPHYPNLGKVFVNGYPEVSILWTDPDTGVPMKCRLDYLKRKAIADLKTYSNKGKRPVRRAMTQAFSGDQHNLQAAVYWDALDRARELPAFGKHDPAWLKACLDEPEHGFIYVYVKTTGAALVRGMPIYRQSVDVQFGVNTMRLAIEQYAAMWRTFGPDKWFSLDDMEPLNDGEISPFRYE